MFTRHWVVYVQLGVATQDHIEEAVMPQATEHSVGHAESVYSGYLAWSVYEPHPLPLSRAPYSFISCSRLLPCVDQTPPEKGIFTASAAIPKAWSS